MSKLNLQLITPGAVVFEGTVSSVSAPTLKGEIQILPDHADFLGVLGVGLLKAEQAGVWLVWGGTVFVCDDVVKIAADGVIEIGSQEARTLIAKHKELEHELAQSTTLSAAELEIVNLQYQKSKALLSVASV